MSTALQRAGWQINHTRRRRIRGQESLFCQVKRRFVPTTNSPQGLRRSPNRLGGRELTAPKQAWVADITDICLPRSFVYLATLLDAYWRGCVGWQLSRHSDTPLALDALNMALAGRGIGPGLIHHSDQGVQ